MRKHPRTPLYRTWPERLVYIKLQREKEQQQAYASSLLKKFGTRVYDKQVMLEKQNGCCGNIGCAIPLTKPLNKIHMDHCHKTGVVRGLLCDNCNFALGMVYDDPARLVGLLEYLLRARNNVA